MERPDAPVDAGGTDSSDVDTTDSADGSPCRATFRRAASTRSLDGSSPRPTLMNATEVEHDHRIALRWGTARHGPPCQVLTHSGTGELAVLPTIEGEEWSLQKASKFFFV